MGQLGFFDADKRLQALSARGDPLEAIDQLVPWETICWTSRWNIRCATGCRSRAFWGSIEDSIPDAMTRLAVPREAGQGRADRKAVPLRPASLRPKTTWRVAGRSSTPASCWCRAGWAHTSG